MTVPQKPSGRAHAPAVIIVNNLDYPVRYAAWFGKKRAQTAIRLAKAAGFHVLDVNTERLEKLAGCLKEGSAKGGEILLSPVDMEILPDLHALIHAGLDAGATTERAAEAPEAGISNDPGSDPVEHSQSSSAAEDDAWNNLQPGALVLAANLDRQGAAEFWIEAIIVRIEGPEFVLRWRDFPREGLLTRTRRHIAILPPAE